MPNSRALHGPFSPVGLRMAEDCLKHSQVSLNAQLFDAVGMALHGKTSEIDITIVQPMGPYLDGHWFTQPKRSEEKANPESKFWPTRIPFELRGLHFEGWLPPADDPHNIVLFTSDEVDKEVLDEAGWVFGMAFVAIYWLTYSNKILNPA